MAGEQGQLESEDRADRKIFNTKFSVVETLKETFRVFFANQRSFWRLIWLPWLLLFIFGHTTKTDFSELSSVGPPVAIRWLLLDSLKILIYALIVSPFFVAWHRAALLSKPLPKTWFISFKYDRATWKFLVGFFIFYSALNNLPKFATSIVTLHMEASSPIYYGLIWNFTLAITEAAMLILFYRAFLLFPELATGQFESIKTTISRSAVSKGRFFLMLLSLYVLYLVATTGIILPLNFFVTYLTYSLPLDLESVAYIHLGVLGPLYIFLNLVCTVISAIALSLSFKRLSELQKNATDDAETT